MQKTTYLGLATVGLAAFLAGQWTNSSTRVKAASTEAPVFQVQPIRGDTSLTVYYPSLNKMFVYQTPFAGMPKWNCAYSIQLGTPGGSIVRQPCPHPGQQF
jgi:hypothetical protein